MITGLPMPDAVTVLVSTELLAELEDWSAPVQIQVRRTPGIGSGYELVARTHTCQPDTVAVVHGGIDSEAYARIWNEGYAEAQRQEHDQPMLGLATTQGLIVELAARADVAATIGEAWPTYTTVVGHGQLDDTVSDD